MNNSEKKNYFVINNCMIPLDGTFAFKGVSIIGIGGCGTNSIIRFKEKNKDYEELYAFDDDNDTLSKADITNDNKLDISVYNSEKDICTWVNENILNQTTVICCGLGGESGTTVQIVKYLLHALQKEHRRIILCVVTPFRFESRDRNSKALASLKLFDSADFEMTELICFSNNILLNIADRHMTLEKVMSIYELVLTTFVNILLNVLPMKKEGRYKFMLNKGGAIDIFECDNRSQNSLVSITMDSEKESIVGVEISTETLS